MRYNYARRAVKVDDHIEYFKNARNNTLLMTTEDASSVFNTVSSIIFHLQTR